MPGTVVITGGNAGIGAAMARAIAEKGHTVKIVCRNRERAGAFIDEMKNRGISIGLIEGDLGTVASACEAARRVLKDAPDCGIFIHNAGMWPVEKTINADGFEQSFATNHMAPFVMNVLLENMFKKNRTRIVQISAGLYVAGIKDCEAAATGSNFSLTRTYATTKLMNLVATMEFALAGFRRGHRRHSPGRGEHRARGHARRAGRAHEGLQATLAFARAGG